MTKAEKTKGITLVVESKDDRIVDLKGKVYTIAEAKALWESGTLKDWNLALMRLAQNDWDFAKLKEYWKAADAASGR